MTKSGKGAQTLWVTMRARTDKFTKDVKKGRTSLLKFKAVLPGVNKLLGLFAGALALKGMHHFIRSQMLAIDQIAKMSDEMGFATEALAGYHHAANLTGTKIEVVNKGLQRMMRRVGEATMGLGEGIKGLDMLGLSAQQLKKMKAEDIFSTIAEGIKSMNTEAERAAAAYLIFGRQGQEMMNFFLLGKEGIAATRKEAEMLGLTFTRMEGARVEAANDAIERAKRVFTGFQRHMAIALSKPIEEMTKKFTDWAMSGGGVREKVASVIEFIVRGAGEVARAVAEVAQGLGNINMLVANMKLAAANALPAVDKTTNAIRDAAILAAQAEVTRAKELSDIDIPDPEVWAKRTMDALNDYLAVDLGVPKKAAAPPVYEHGVDMTPFGYGGLGVDRTPFGKGGLSKEMLEEQRITNHNLRRIAEMFPNLFHLPALVGR